MSTTEPTVTTDPTDTVELPPVVASFAAAAAEAGLAFEPRQRDGATDAPSAWTIYNPELPRGERDELWLRWVPSRIHKGRVVTGRYTSVTTRRHREHYVQVPHGFALRTILPRLAGRDAA